MANFILSHLHALRDIFESFDLWRALRRPR
jgi:hypothetical protein